MDNLENFKLAKEIYCRAFPNTDLPEKLLIKEMKSGYINVDIATLPSKYDTVARLLRKLLEMESAADQFNTKQEDKNTYGLTFIPYSA